jgi:restriction system protein
LVTTSHYGTDAYNFAKDKPIELIDGGGLLYLLEQNGIKAKIIFPQE